MEFESSELCSIFLSRVRLLFVHAGSGQFDRALYSYTVLLVSKV